MAQRCARIVIDVAGEHCPQLPRVLVGNRDQHFTEGHPGGQLADPELFGSSLFRADRFGPLQAAACALDQERAQVHIAATTDRAEPGVAATGMLCGYETEPGGQLPAVLEVPGRTDTGDHRISRQRADAKEAQDTQFSEKRRREAQDTQFSAARVGVRECLHHFAGGLVQRGLSVAPCAAPQMLLRWRDR